MPLPFLKWGMAVDRFKKKRQGITGGRLKWERTIQKKKSTVGLGGRRERTFPP